MARIKVSTTVDESLLEEARRSRPQGNDAALLDDWEDLASSREAAGRS